MNGPRFVLVWIVLIISASLLWSANQPQNKKESADQLIARAEAAEEIKDWDSALQSYLRAFLAGRQSAEIRQRISKCYRYVSQIRRHRDPAFQRQILNLSSAESLNLYVEVLEKITVLHVEREQATPAKLFLNGLDELDRALTQKEFRSQYLSKTSDLAIAKFQRTLKEFWKSKLPRTTREVRSATLELTRTFRAELGVQSGSVLILEMICGSCSSLDDYTVYLTPSIDSIDQAGIAELAEYGIAVQFRNGELRVESIAADSWAAENTILKRDDRITRINGRLVKDKRSLAESLQSAQNGEHQIEIENRADVMATLVGLPTPVPTVQQATIIQSKDAIGYLKIKEFNEQTPLEVESALLRLKEQGMRSLILDLRGNSGGNFISGVRAAERFLPNGVIATTDSQVPDFAGRVFSSESGMMAFDLPMVVLMDARTMSAAEVVVSSLKEQQRALVVGMPSFGKGVIQHAFKLTAADHASADGVHNLRSGTLILTIAKIFTARGSPLDGQGIVPDVLEADPVRQLAIAIERLSMR